MHWLTHAYTMTVVACVTLALVHLLVWFKQPKGRVHLAFFMTAIFVAAITPFEWSMARAETTVQFGSALRWLQVPASLAIVSLVWFLWLYFGTGRRWLALATCITRVLAMTLSFFFSPNLNYRKITELRQVALFGGERASAAIGPVNPWTLIGQLSSLLLLAYVLDASVRLWRKGDRNSQRRAAVLGGATAFFVIGAAGQAALILSGLIVSPFFVSLPFLAVVLAMGYELSLDVVRAGQLSLEVKESEERQRDLLRATPDLIFLYTLDGVYLDYYAKDESDLFLPPDAFLGKNMKDVLPAEVLRAIVPCFRRALDTCEVQVMEYSLPIQDQERWFEARVLRNSSDQILSVVRDVTDRKQAEEALRDLSGRLINAQEEERSRVARELHDDLSQRIAVLSIGLEQAAQQIAEGPDSLRTRIHGLYAETQEILTAIHRLSYQLHPSKLDHLGLVAAARSFCAELAARYDLAIKFRHQDVPASLAQDVTLCLFRIVQESLNNAVSHSGAREVQVVLEKTAQAIRLSVSDLGCGFDTESSKMTSGLGFISMRERLRLVGGQLSIRSHPFEGTQIEATIPMMERAKHASAASSNRSTEHPRTEDAIDEASHVQ